MTNNRSEQFARALKSEVPLWVQNGLIQDESAKALLSMYPVSESNNRLVTIISIFGSVLMGLGILLFVGSNWHAMSSLLKLGIICGAIVAINLAALKLNHRSSHPNVGSALYLLGGIVYGAGIWLISQTFQLDLNWSFGLSLWSLGLVPMILLTRNVPLLALNSVIALLWTVSDQHFPEALLVLIFSFGLSYFIKSRIALVLTLIQGICVCYINTDYNSQASMMPAFLYAVVLFSWYLWHRLYKPLFANCYMIISLLIGFGCLYVTTLDTPEVFSLAHLQTPFAVLALVATASIIFIFEKVEANRAELIAAISLIPTMMLITHGPGSINWSGRLFANIALFTSLIGMIGSGARRIESPLAVNLCTIFFAIAVLTRYFDTFFAMLNRSIFFMLGGLILLGGGYLLERQRRTFVRGIAHD